MEKEDYKFKVTNIKISVKLPQSAGLDFVVDRCRLLQPIHRNLSWKKCGNNILTLRYNNFTYILFKKSSKSVHEGIDRPQHCNITKIKSESDISEAIGHLFFLVNQTPTWLNYTIDNYSCLANTNQLIDIVELYMNELTISCDYNEQLFPALKIYCPIEISERNLTSLVYKSGSVIFVGGNNLNEVKEFFNWVLKITQKYPKL
jgi:hypothetical protein